MSLVDEEIAKFHEKLSDDGVYAAHHDAQYDAEWHYFRHVLAVMDTAMEAAGLMGDTRRQIIKHVLSAAPNEGNAIQRISAYQSKLDELSGLAPPAIWPQAKPWLDNIMRTW